MKTNKKGVLKQKNKTVHPNPKSEIIIAVLAIISKKSRERDRTIAATSLQEIEKGLKEHYSKDVTERHILNVIRSLGKLVIKEKDPRNNRRSIYRTNPKFVEEVTLTLVKLTNEQAHNSKFEGILYAPLVKTDKEKFLVIDHSS
jgi:hypothetical protein